MQTSILLVSIFALTLVWFMWRGMRGNLHHLSEKKLTDFLSNRLEGTALKHTREHLLQCDECKEILNDLTKISQKQKPERLLKRRF